MKSFNDSILDLVKDQYSKNSPVFVADNGNSNISSNPYFKDRLIASVIYLENLAASGKIKSHWHNGITYYSPLDS